MHNGLSALLTVQLRELKYGKPNQRKFKIFADLPKYRKEKKKISWSNANDKVDIIQSMRELRNGNVKVDTSIHIINSIYPQF